jgi:molybdopterin-containing oxidoreductase family iron-sulfur binding subunit
MSGDERRGEAGMVPVSSLTRRGLFEAAGAAVALAGAQACSRGPQEYIVPYVNQPPEVTPGVPTRYATTMTIGGHGIGLVVECHEGRPTKAEGNPAHPASLGALGSFEQASVIGLYEPQRAEAVLRGDVPVPWRDLAGAIAAPAPAGKRTHVLLEPTGSPHVADLVRQVRARGDVAVHFYEPIDRGAPWTGSKLAFGRALEPLWDFSRADVVVTLDADFLAAVASPPAWARAWASRRRLDGPGGSMSRLYAVEPRLSVTGMSADDRLAVQGRRVREVAAALLTKLVAHTKGVSAALKGAAASRAPGEHDDWADKVARDLASHAGASAVVPGERQPPEVHALAHAMNALLGNFGKTVSFVAPAIFEAGEPSHGLRPLLQAIDAGEVHTLVIVGGDPAYSAPADLDLGQRISSVTMSAYVGLYANATARRCGWFAPEAYFLEAWGDATAFDGTISLAQPLIRPLVEGHTAGQVLAALLGKPEAPSRELLEGYWRERHGRDFDREWQRSLVHGVVEGSRPAPADVRIDWGAIAQALSAVTPPKAALEIVYFPDSKVYDGRYANISQLQELADPVTKLTWDNAALVSPATAAKYQLETGDGVVLRVGDRAVNAPAVVVPNMAEDVVAIAVGYGQTTPGLTSSDVGSNAYSLRQSGTPWFDESALERTHRSWELAFTQRHSSAEGRPIALARTLDAYRLSPDFAKPHNEAPETLYGLRPDAPVQWGMTIDLNACTGCSACVMACQAENNIPVVGKGGVRLSREMHWIRIDRYYDTDEGKPGVVVQPMLCQHCEKAPCEYVCPVNATVHSPDGLNEMVYNRCVGTRFCSNNCPYKVRRFNFFNYNWQMPARPALAMNPDVTVRARGVMEKCTYCVQRIREAEIRARRERRALREGEVVTACQQTCPTGAIVFGDIANPTTAVARSRDNPRLYQVLQDLGTVPRTRYLARVTNPNPELAPS